VRGHLGHRRVAARAHRDRREQLLGTRIAHAGSESRPVGALVIGVVLAPLRGREVALARGPDDTLPDVYAARRTVALPTVTPSADREEEAAIPTENESMVVQVPTPSDAFLARRRVIGDGPPAACPRDNEGRELIPPGLLPFVPSVAGAYAKARPWRSIRRTSTPLPTDRRRRSHSVYRRAGITLGARGRRRTERPRTAVSPLRSPGLISEVEPCTEAPGFTGSSAPGASVSGGSA